MNKIFTLLYSLRAGYEFYAGGTDFLNYNFVAGKGFRLPYRFRCYYTGCKVTYVIRLDRTKLVYTIHNAQ